MDNEKQGDNGENPDSLAAPVMSQEQVNTEGAQLWAQHYTRSACDAKLLQDGATQFQIDQFHLSFDVNHTWPPEP